MNNLSSLVPVLLVVRVIFDLAAVAAGRTSHYFEFAYFLLFSAAAALIFSLEPDASMWAWLSSLAAIFSLVSFLVKYSRSQSEDADG